ncbi:Dipeptidyl peptidase 2 [Phytophthora boehmeriae]|uniref:Dipeptidyl peptidase 2 n=1 Tax=Phytophthora boehmeriae TaxID=109152 RepID=A0A8T1WSE9_9STRA|nr:Dipeptidyl peptidase 2 [Phytophthora boehmeriae]
MSTDVGSSADATMAPAPDPQDAEASGSEIVSSGNFVSTQNKRVKWARLLLRELYDLGFRDAAAALEREAAVQLCSPAMKRFQTLVSAQKWDSALELVTRKDGKLQMKSIQATREAGLLLLQRKYIELLLKSEVKDALKTFQEEILPVYNPSEKEVKQLAELLLCQSVDEMKERAQMPWQDDQLRARIEGLVSPEEIIPEGALRRLVQDGPEMNLQPPQPLLTGQVTGECMDILQKPTGDVWELAFSPDGQLLASASSDGSVVLWKLEFDTDPLYGTATGTFDKQFQHPAGVVLSIQWLPCGDQFVSGSADKSLVLWNANDGSVAYQWSGRRALDIVVHPHESKVFVLVSGYEIRTYDIAQKTDGLFFKAERVISCIEISPCGKFLLINFVKQEQLVCLDIATVSIIAKYHGISEKRYVLRPCFCGTHCELVVSGSEDGRVYLWHRDSGKLLSDLDGHSSVVNVVVRHPSHANVIASASDDRTVRLWCLKSSE